MPPVMRNSFRWLVILIVLLGTCSPVFSQDMDENFPDLKFGLKYEGEVPLSKSGTGYVTYTLQVSPDVFAVKVGLPPMDGLYSGMFGRLLVPVGERDVVLVPRSAVKRIGQLEVVTMEAGGRWQQIYVRTGRSEGKRVEILSGLKGGETLAVDGGNDA